ncbi:nickel transport system permease protein [Aneurinibacillus soli]|uniref:Glutathione transport system permease protein GsiD n=1 Tax=Aneurinibacillus soli TaxID=1500254 RepID=A0A0U5B1L8_9BACL|nr:ABC transporter permease subunit [Aneurinibacillus soli]PYE61660.1 nickel transport system permease protein [Aneurinibacillus soli]BAU28482.1 Glutathione transport system permease protein GsiD [Aneurinibacillus soli]
MDSIRQIFLVAGRQRIIVICVLLLSAIVLAGLLAPILAPNDPVLVDLSHKLEGPSAQFPLGTDQLGRCILSRLLYGTQVSLSLALLIVCSCVVLGLVIGCLAGYAGGKIDSIIMRGCDAVLAFPALILAISLIAIWGAGWKQMALALIIVQSVYYARFIRGIVSNLKQQNYIVAARICGTSPFRMMLRHIIPNLLPSLFIVVTLEIGWVIMDISALSFIGLGVQSPTPEWGAMINEGKSFLRSHPRLMIVPGLMIFCMVALLNILGETLGERKGLTKSIRKIGRVSEQKVGGTR